MHNLAHILTENKPVLESEGYEEKLPIWEKGNKICHHTILITLSNELFDKIATIKMPKKFGIYYTKNTLLKMLEIKNMP